MDNTNTTQDLEKIYAELRAAYEQLSEKIAALQHAQADVHKEISAAIDDVKIKNILDRINKLQEPQ